MDWIRLTMSVIGLRGPPPQHQEERASQVGGQPIKLEGITQSTSVNENVRKYLAGAQCVCM